MSLGEAYFSFPRPGPTIFQKIDFPETGSRRIHSYPEAGSQRILYALSLVANFQHTKLEFPLIFLSDGWKKYYFWTQSGQIVIDLSQIRLGKDKLGIMPLMPEQIPFHFTDSLLILALPAMSLCVWTPLSISLSLSLCVTTNYEPDHGPPALTIWLKCLMLFSTSKKPNSEFWFLLHLVLPPITTLNFGFHYI